MANDNKLELIKELRQRTNSALGDCKKALEATSYDIEAAIKWLRENGIVKAAKKAGRVAAEGVVAAIGNEKEAVLVEINAETDFVAKNAQFMELVSKIVNAVFKSKATTLQEALDTKISDNETVAQALINATAVIGENISLRRIQRIVAKDGDVLGVYQHANNRVAAIVEVKGANSEMARNVSMHVSAMNPEFILVSQIPADRLEEIKSRFETPANFDKKPANIQEKIVSGWLDKQLSEIVLEKQPFVMEDSLTVEKYLANANGQLVDAYRFEVGEGIEKVASDFAAEVASMTKK